MSSYFALAERQARKSLMLHQIGCVAVIRGKVVAKSHNTDGYVRIDGKSLRSHAETTAIAALLRSYPQERLSKG